jgi:hypothetical protein
MIQELPNFLFPWIMVFTATGWLALIFFPRHSWANFWYAGVIVPLLLSLTYIYLLLTYWFQPPAGHLPQFLTLKGVYTMFGNSGLLLVGWIDLIAMGLAVGAWMTRKAAQIRMPYVYLLPCLVLAFVFGGVGFTMYVVFAAMKGGWGEISKFEGQPPIGASPVFARPEWTRET